MLLLHEGGQVCRASRAALPLSLWVFPGELLHSPLTCFFHPKLGSEPPLPSPALSVGLASESHYRTRGFSAGSFPSYKRGLLSVCVLHRLSPLQLGYWFLGWSLMDTFEFTGSSCLKPAKGSTVTDAVVPVEGVSFHLIGCEEPTGRLCDVPAASSVPVLPSLQVCKPACPQV